MIHGSPCLWCWWWLMAATEHLNVTLLLISLPIFSQFISIYGQIMNVTIYVTAIVLQSWTNHLWISDYPIIKSLFPRRSITKVISELVHWNVYTCIHVINELSWLNMVKPCSVLPISAKKSGLLLQQHWTPRRLGFRAKRCNSSLRPAARRCWRQKLRPIIPTDFWGKTRAGVSSTMVPADVAGLRQDYLSIAESLTHQSRLDVYPLTNHWLCQWNGWPGNPCDDPKKIIQILWSVLNRQGKDWEKTEDMSSRSFFSIYGRWGLTPLILACTCNFSPGWGD